VSDLEHDLRALFRDKQAMAPAAKPVSEYLNAPAATSPRWQWVAVPAAVLVTVAVVVGVAALSDRPTTSGPVVAPPPSAQQGALFGGPDSAVSCVKEYSPQEVARRSFAFDGTVTGIGQATTGRSDRGPLSLAGVTFEINEWFKGGSEDTVMVDLPPPVAAGRSREGSESSSAYEVGTRLLVSGEPRWGGLAPLKDPIAWGCGFTRYWDQKTAEDWRTASTEWTESLTRADCPTSVSGINDYIAGGPNGPVDETPPVELAASFVDGIKLVEDFPDVSVVVGRDYDVSQEIWILSKDQIIGKLSYARGDSGWYNTQMTYCTS
jgi:hypothetical protein